MKRLSDNRYVRQEELGSRMLFRVGEEETEKVEGKYV